MWCFTVLRLQSALNKWGCTICQHLLLKANLFLVHRWPHRKVRWKACLIHEHFVYCSITCRCCSHVVEYRKTKTSFDCSAGTCRFVDVWCYFWHKLSVVLPKLYIGCLVLSHTTSLLHSVSGSYSAFMILEISLNNQWITSTSCSICSPVCKNECKKGLNFYLKFCPLKSTSSVSSHICNWVQHREGLWGKTVWKISPFSLYPWFITPRSFLCQ